MKQTLITLVALSLILAVGGGAGAHSHGGAVQPVFAIAELAPFEEGGPSGTATFLEVDGRVYITVRAHGLENPKQGIHIHEIGDLSTPGASGGHFNPTDGVHAHPDDPDSHAGDLLNLLVDEYGVGTMYMVKENITLSPGPLSVAGRALVIHAEEDHFEPDHIGGARVAGGIIEVLE